MKTFILLMTMCVAAGCSAQPSDIDLAYLFYLNGSNVVAVTNKSNCNTQVRVSWKKGGLNKDTLIGIAFDERIILHLPGDFTAGSEIKAKSEGTCPNNGWTRITVPKTLDIKIVSFAATRKSGTVVLEYELFFEDAGDYCVLEKSTNGHTFIPLHYIRDATERTYLDKETESVFYRIHSYPVNGGQSYSRVVSVGPSYHKVQLADRTQIFTQDGKFVGYFSRWDHLPKRIPIILKNSTETRRIAILN